MTANDRHPEQLDSYPDRDMTPRHVILSAASRSVAKSKDLRLLSGRFMLVWRVILTKTNLNPETI